MQAERATTKRTGSRWRGLAVLREGARPEPAGIEPLVAQLRERLRAEGLEVPIVFLAGYDPTKFEAPGADAELPRPFDAENVNVRLPIAWSASSLYVFCDADSTYRTAHALLERERDLDRFEAIVARVKKARTDAARASARRVARGRGGAGEAPAAAAAVEEEEAERSGEEGARGSSAPARPRGGDLQGPDAYASVVARILEEKEYIFAFLPPDGEPGVPPAHHLRSIRERRYGVVAWRRGDVDARGRLRLSLHTHVPTAITHLFQQIGGNAFVDDRVRVERHALVTPTAFDVEERRIDARQEV